MIDEPRTVAVDPNVPTVEKVTPALEGAVSMQQLLDAMAVMARDIDELRAQLADALAKVTRHVDEAERQAREHAETAQQFAGNAAAIIAQGPMEGAPS